MKQLVSINKHVQYGSPCVAGRGIPTACIKGMFLGGDSVTTISKWYEIKRQQTEAALRYELATPALKRKLARMVK